MGNAPSLPACPQEKVGFPTLTGEALFWAAPNPEMYSPLGRKGVYPQSARLSSSLFTPSNTHPLPYHCPAGHGQPEWAQLLS